MAGPQDPAAGLTEGLRRSATLRSNPTAATLRVPGGPREPSPGRDRGASRVRFAKNVESTQPSLH